MNAPEKSIWHRSFLVFFLLAGLTFSIYGHVLDAAWQFDDRPNIVNNAYLHIDNLMPETLGPTFFANQGKGGRLFRPVACLTFALNWLQGGSDPAVFRFWNLVIHILTAFFLYRFVYLLWETPGLKNSATLPGRHFIALLTAVLWAANPIQTQAVTYIVQRMTSLAALFYILGMSAYLRARLTDDNKERWFGAVACLGYFILAVGSKENAAVLPGSLLLVEWIFFQDRARLRALPMRKLATAAALACLAVIAVIWVLDVNPLKYLSGKGYAYRPFTMVERVLTQPRVIWFYISLIFLPAPHRLSVVHDIVLSRSLVSPWSTLPAMLLIVAMILVAARFAWRYRLGAFAVLFFFLNHVVESSFIPLELVFEHRNYLPSFFVFLPIAAMVWSGLDRYQGNWLMRGLIIFAVVVVMTSFGLGTHLRNMAWKTPETLWADASRKAPGKARPLNNLAIRLAWSDNPSREDYTRALALFHKSLTLDIPRRLLEREILGNIGAIYFNTGYYEQAIQYHRRAMAVDPSFTKGRYDLIQPLILTRRWEEANQEAQKLLKKARFNAKYLDMIGFLLLHQDRHQEALIVLRRALRLDPGRSSTWLNIGVALSRSKSYANAEWFLLQAAKRNPRDIYPLLALIENSERAGDGERAMGYSRRMAARFPVTFIRSAVDGLEDNLRVAPISRSLTAPVVDAWIRKQADLVR